jgi:hypothetical protein
VSLTKEDRGRDVRPRRQLTINPSDIAPPHDFGHQLRHYVVAPELREGQKLVEIVRLVSGELAKIDIHSLGTVEEPQLELSLSSAQAFSSSEVGEARRLVVWRLGLEDALRPFYAAVADDPVLSASIEHNFGAKGKSAFSMFDAVIDVICAQRPAGANRLQWRGGELRRRRRPMVCLALPQHEHRGLGQVARHGVPAEVGGSERPGRSVSTRRTHRRPLVSFPLTVVSGTCWETPQCSIILPSALKRRMSTTAAMTA